MGIGRYGGAACETWRLWDPEKAQITQKKHVCAGNLGCRLGEVQTRTERWLGMDLISVTSDQQLTALVPKK